MKMIVCLIAVLFCLFTACSKETVTSTVVCEEGYHLDDLVPLPNGMKLRVTEVNDYYCPCNVNCIWGGYLEVIVQAEGANRAPDTLGWQDRIATFGDYAVTLGEIYNQPTCGGSLDANAFCFEVKVE